MDHRLVVDGVMWRTRTGSPWRDLPDWYENWKTVYNRHRRWSADGTWEQVLAGLRAGCDQLEWAEWVVSVDATVIRAHRHSVGARHDPPKDVPAQRLASLQLEDVVRPAGHTGGCIE